MAKNHGKIAEDLVAGKLVEQGWEILARNFRRTGFELDIVAEKHSTLVIIEVKHRRNLKHGLDDYRSILSTRKRMSLQKGANAILEKLARNYVTVRFDLALVEGDTNSKIQYRYFANVMDA